MRDTIARGITYLTVGTALYLVFVKSKTTGAIIKSSGQSVAGIVSAVEGNTVRIG